MPTQPAQSGTAGYKPGPRPPEYYAEQTKNPVTSKLSFDEIIAKVKFAQNRIGMPPDAHPEILGIVFFDPQCKYCAKLSMNLASADAIKVVNNIAWVPIGFLHEYSTMQGAAILSSANPILTLIQHETFVNAGSGQEFSLNVKGATQENIDRVVENTKIWREAGANQVPFIVTKGGKGQTLALYGVLEGFQMAEFLSRP